MGIMMGIGIFIGTIEIIMVIIKHYHHSHHLCPHPPHHHHYKLLHPPPPFLSSFLAFEASSIVCLANLRLAILSLANQDMYLPYVPRQRRWLRLGLISGSHGCLGSSPGLSSTDGGCLGLLGAWAECSKGLCESLWGCVTTGNYLGLSGAA